MQKGPKTPHGAWHCGGGVAELTCLSEEVKLKNFGWAAGLQLLLLPEPALEKAGGEGLELRLVVTTEHLYAVASITRIWPRRESSS